MRVVLRRGKEKHLRRGHPWVFRDVVEQVSGDPGIGDVVSVATAEGEVLGQGLFHPESWIQVRILTREPDADVEELLRQRVRDAVAQRDRWFGPESAARLLFSESDGVPGTVVDRYGDVLAWSTICAGIERRRDSLLDVLEECCRPAAIVQRDDQWLRAKDGLQEQRGVLRGSLPEVVEIQEEGLHFRVDVLRGPKTGFFLDQRFHRARARIYAREQRVLDVFCADGGFGLHAAAAGAREVWAIDSSQPALERARWNAERNGLAERFHFERADALERLHQLREAGERFGLIILDPPAFARGRRESERALRAYQSLNIEALRMLEPGGVLATSSCSSAVTPRDFRKLLLYAARRAECEIRILERGCQPPDHPVLPGMPETEYLDFFVVQRSSSAAAAVSTSVPDSME